MGKRYVCRQDRKRNCFNRQTSKIKSLIIFYSLLYHQQSSLLSRLSHYPSKTPVQNDRHLQFLICINQQPIGTIFTYSYNKVDKYAFVSVFIEDEYANRSYGIKSFLKLSQQLFGSSINLYKLYIDIYDYNKKMLSIIDKCKFSIEGVFKDQHLANGKRYDVYRYAIYWKIRLT